MKKFNTLAYRFFICCILSVIMVSCGNMKETTTSKLVQKRKYTKGFHVNLKSPKSFSNPNRIQSSEEKLALLAGEDSLMTSSETRFLAESKLEVPEEVTASLTVSDIELTDEKPIIGSESSLPGKFELDEAYMIPATKNGLRLFKKKQKAGDGTVVRTTPSSAILSFIFGIACLFVLALPLGLVALILGIVAVSKISKNPELYKGQGFAIVGIILGAIGVLVGLIVLSAAASTV